MLIDFISEYLRHSEVRQRFARNPLEVFDQFQVTPRQRELLREHDKEGVLAAVRDELEAAWAAKAAENPGVLGWGTPGIEVTDVQPSSAQVKAKTRVVVTGSGFPTKQDAELLFQAGSTSESAKVLSVEQNADGTSRLEAEAMIKKAGSYTVTVRNSDGSQSGSWDQHFTVS